MQARAQKADEDVLSRRPGGAGGDGDFQDARGEHFEGGMVVPAVLAVGTELRGGEAGGVEDGGGDEVVPGAEAEVAVQEEEDEEEGGHEVVYGLEEFVEAVANTSARCSVCLCQGKGPTG